MCAGRIRITLQHTFRHKISNLLVAASGCRIVQINFQTHRFLHDLGPLRALGFLRDLRFLHDLRPLRALRFHKDLRIHWDLFGILLTLVAFSFR